MKIADISKRIANSVGEALEELQDAQAEKRQRWFDYDEETGVYNLHRETIEYLNHQSELPLLGLEHPHSVKLSKLEVEIETDVSVEGSNEDMVTGSTNEPSTLRVKLEMEHTQASDGMLALHKLASREWREFAKHFHSELFEPPENMEEDKE